jgi:hypothetical protein
VVDPDSYNRAGSIALGLRLRPLSNQTPNRSNHQVQWAYRRIPLPSLIARAWSAGSIEPLNTTTGISRRLHRFKSSTPPNSNTPISAMTRFGVNPTLDSLASAPEKSFAVAIVIGAETCAVILLDEPCIRSTVLYEKNFQRRWSGHHLLRLGQLRSDLSDQRVQLLAIEESICAAILSSGVAPALGGAVPVLFAALLQGFQNLFDIQVVLLRL